MISLQVKTHPKKHLLIIPSVLDDFTPGDNPPEKASTYNTFGLG